ncbi:MULTISPECIES: Flp pilus assembly protein CpaB [unclassified Microbacterium]|uniref:Flp pilus assembly protein CpaB n=1 Tax=unclassified Microbacterium TaxID=2609290 RepID=UPI0012FB4289|nr:RcpC/CpaB family pilus assembly protein [Microbacterium sp. MAH-37]MVQ43719.1 hypothetical protein [Microbacterium sp. MAH-37]
MKTRIIGAVLALVLAIVGAFFLITYVNNANARAQKGAELTEVYVVKTEIPRGTSGEAVKDFVVTDTVPKRNEVPDAVTDLADLDGLLASEKLLPGEQLSAARFVTPEGLAATGEIPVPKGMQKLSFTVPADRAVGGEIKAGDYIGLIGTADPDEPGDQEDVLNPQSHFAFHNVLVTRVQGVSKPAKEGESAEQAAGSKIMLTIALSAPDAERWVWFTEGDNEDDEMGHAQIWLTLENPDTDNSGTRWVTGANAW